MAEPMEIRVERDQLQRIVQIEGDTVTVGRGQECEVRLDDPKASRRHCRVERLGQEVFLVDLDSANGTWVDGVRVHDRRPLARNERVRVGSTTFCITGGVSDSLSAVESTQTQQTPREQDVLRTLLAVGRALAQEDKAERMAALVIDAAVSMARAERGFVFLVEDGRTSLALGRNFAREPVAAPEDKVSRTLLGKALESREPLLVEDAASDGEFAGVESISDLGLRSLLAVPLRGRDAVVGLLVVDHRMASGAFRDEELAMLGGLAGIAGVHLASAVEAGRVRRLERKVQKLEKQLGKEVKSRAEGAGLDTPAGRGFAGLIGTSPAMQRLYESMERILDSDVGILITGESGTGKELVARALHFHGRNADRPFVVENCGALPDTLLESELFGHVKGAFTGANRDRRGRFEEADGGTIFLDEVSEMSEAMQSRLLRVLQEGEIRPVGSNEVRKIDVRVIAATNVDLKERVEAGRFREDLYYRLKVVGIELPPLRERRGDVVVLAEHFLEQEAAEQGKLPRELGDDARARLEEYAWPGNVRELRNEMRRATLLGEGTITVSDLSPEIAHAGAGQRGDPGPDHPLPERVEALEKAAIREALEQEPDNRSRAARLLGITRFTLLRKIEKYGLEDPRKAGQEEDD